MPALLSTAVAAALFAPSMTTPVGGSSDDMPPAQRRRANGAWGQMLFTVRDDVLAGVRYAQGQERASVQLFGEREVEDKLSPDLCDWQTLTEYLRVSFQLGASVALELRLAGNPIVAYDSVSLSTMGRYLDRLTLDAAQPIALEAHARAVPPHYEPDAAKEEVRCRRSLSKRASAHCHRSRTDVPCTHCQALHLEPVFGSRPLTLLELTKRLRVLLSSDAANVKDGRWTHACSELMARCPTILLRFDELRGAGFAAAIGNGHFLLNPMTIACPACLRIQILDNANTVHNLIHHLEHHCRGTHATAILKRVQAWRENNCITHAQLDSIMELPPNQPAPPVERPDYFRRPHTPWLQLWLGWLVVQLTTRHVLVQLLIASLYMAMGAEVIYWSTHFPNLLSMAHELYYTARPRGYRLIRGVVYAGQGKRSETRIAVDAVEELPSGMVMCHVSKPKAWVTRLTPGSRFWCSSDDSYQMELLELKHGEGHGATLALRTVGGATVGLRAPFELIRQRHLLGRLFNFLLPPEETLRLNELPPTFQSATHYHKILALQLSCPRSAPALRSETCIAIPGTLFFDERALNQEATARLLMNEGRKSAVLLGIFERQDGGSLEPFSAQRCHELVQSGLPTVRKAVASAVYTKSVKEYNFQTFDGSVCVNVRTEYEAGDEASAQAKKALLHAHSKLLACDACIGAGRPELCVITLVGEPCTACAAKGTMCTYVFAPLTSCDQGAGQRKACGELSDSFDKAWVEWQEEDETGEASDLAIEWPHYLRPTHGFLHGLKSMIGTLRNYRTVGFGSDGEFGVHHLTAIATSKSLLGAELLQATTADCFNYLDRHSDRVCHLTIFEPVQRVLRECKFVKATLVPEPFRVWAKRVANQSTELSRPASLVLNSRGEVLYSDPDAHTIGFVSRNTPAKLLIVAGQYGKQGSIAAGAAPVRGTSGKLHTPLQIALLVVKRGRDERLLICDTGNKSLRLLSGAHHLDTRVKQMLSSVQLGSGPHGARIVPSAVCVVSLLDPSSQQVVPVLALGDLRAQSVSLVRMRPDFTRADVMTHQTWGMASPWSLASFDLRLYVCDEGAVRMINLTAAGAPPCQLSMAVLDPRGVAAVASPTAQGKHHVLVTDGASHKLYLFEVDSLGGCSLLATWGSGASRNLDGPIADAAFQEPWGVAQYCGTWYVACYGGKDGGSICVVTPVTFAVKICELMEASYDAIGYVSPRLKRDEAASARAARKATGVHVQLKKVRVQLTPSLAYLTCLLISHDLNLNGCSTAAKRLPTPHTSQVHTLVEYALELCRSRSTAIGGLAPDGGDGSFNRHTLGGLKYSVSNVAHVLNDLEARGVSTDSISLYAMFNESNIEVQFGNLVIMRQADNPTQMQHAAAKSQADRHSINLLATPEFAMDATNGRAREQYGGPEAATLSAATLQRAVELAHQKLHPMPVPLTASEREVAEAELADMKVMAINAQAQRCSTTRDRYKRPVGVCPTILLHCHALQPADHGSRLTSFETELRRLLALEDQVGGRGRGRGRGREAGGGRDGGGGGRGGGSAAETSREENLLLPRDIVFIVPGDEEQEEGPRGIYVDSSESWWAAQVSKSFPHSRLSGQRPESCVVHVLWCDRIDGSSRWRLVSNGADTVRYGSLVKNEDGTPLIIQHESFDSAGLSRGWESEHGLVYELPDALVEQLDDLTEDAPLPVGLPVGAAGEAEVNAEEEDAEGQDTALEQRATARADAQTLSLQLQRGHLARERRCTRVDVDYRQLGRG